VRCLTFFLSKLEQDQNLSNKIIVFDDPVSSLDGPRRIFTQQQIIKIGQHCRQVILLTHDLSFARLVFYNFRNNKCTLQILRKGTYSILDKWDLESATRSVYFKNYFSISDYLEQGPRDDNHMRDVVRCIRPLLEGYLRTKFPKEFKPEEWLGDFLKKVRSSKNGEPLFAIKDKLPEISEINDYSKKYHHDQNPGADSEPITDTELKAFAKRTIKVIQI
jgi:wobble nucleotide-excising tRNase